VDPGRRPPATLAADELRVDYASLLGWTGGLVIEMVSQVEVASAKVPGLAIALSP
jgi:hypothetical protein